MLGNKNDDTNAISYVLFAIKETKLYIPVITLSVRQSKSIKYLSKGFERSVYWNEYKTKSDNKNTANDYRCFFKSKFVRVNRLSQL